MVTKKLETFLTNLRDTTTLEKARFRFHGFTQDELQKAIRLSYQQMVINNGCTYIDNIGTDDMIDKIADWFINKNKMGLLLMGGLGTGKSTMLKVINVMINKLYFPPACKYIIAYDLESIMRNEDDFKSILNAKILLIDDIAREQSVVKVWGSESTPMVRLLHYRYEHNKQTIMATNYKMPELTTKYGSMIADRIVGQYEIYGVNIKKSFRI
jgi:DNA replication protein DnaC